MYSTDTNEGEKEMSEISEIIENSDMEKEDKKKLIEIIRQEVFEGPIPHPKLLQQYEEVDPGLANTIVNMAIKEQEHRHEIEKTIVKSETLLNEGRVEVIRTSIKLKTRLQI